MDKQAIDSLESRLKQLKSALEDLGDGSEIEEMLVWIHRPGWTTLRDQFFVTGITESLTQQVTSAKQLKEILIGGGRAIIGESEGIHEDTLKKPKAAPPAPAPPGPPGGSSTLGGDGGPSTPEPPEDD